MPGREPGRLGPGSSDSASCAHRAESPVEATALGGAAGTVCDRVRRGDRSARKPTASPGACGTESLSLGLSNGYLKFIW
jgi:hypothetical protein